MQHAIRLAQIPAVSGYSVEMVRNLDKAGLSPWDESTFEPGKHRWFRSDHLLCLTLVEILRIQHVPLLAAATAVQEQFRTVTQFFDAMESGKSESPHQIFCCGYAFSDSVSPEVKSGRVSVTSWSVEEACRWLNSTVEKIGHSRPTRKGKSRECDVGLFLALADLHSAFDVLQSRALEAGYHVKGRQLMRIDSKAAG